ncbi:MAG: metalloprotease [Sphingobacteriales bacterium]|nr:MAG: metalloprotease [Sphingobacteriales bacterium]
MKWLGRRESSNVEFGGGNGGKFALGGIGTIVVVIIGLIMGKNPIELINQVSQNGMQTEQVQQGVDPQNEASKFTKVVLADTEDIWTKIFTENNMQYVQPKLVVFNGQIQSACGGATSASGPFYCPGDQKVYIDLSFYDDLKNRFNASGDFAMAYVIAHEVGHHIQNLMGTTQKLDDARNTLSKEEYNKLSVKLELQADFYAGVWAHYQKNRKNILEEGDIEEALTAANAIGDDKLQQESQGYIVPDAFTHGTSAQRMFWFKKGYETGDIKQGDTFGDL